MKAFVYNENYDWYHDVEISITSAIKDSGLFSIQANISRYDFINYFNLYNQCMLINDTGEIGGPSRIDVVVEKKSMYENYIDNIATYSVSLFEKAEDGFALRGKLGLKENLNLHIIRWGNNKDIFVGHEFPTTYTTIRDGQDILVKNEVYILVSVDENDIGHYVKIKNGIETILKKI